MADGAPARPGSAGELGGRRRPGNPDADLAAFFPEDLIRELGAGRRSEMLRTALSRRWPESADELLTMVRHALLPPGKLLRPVLTLVSAELAGGSPDEVLPAALGMEYLHTATLVHDDVIDADDIRRGRPSVPAAFGAPAAIVTGDYLIFAAFDALAQCHPPLPADRIVAAAGVLAAAGSDMCRGQVLESQITGNAGAQEALYLEMIRLKTGALFRAVCEIGAVLAGADPAQCRQLARYGENLGMAFQIRDDLLAYSMPAEQAGKPATSDLANGRPTLAVLLAFQASGPAGRRSLTAALRQGAACQAHLNTVTSLVRDTGALADSRTRAREYTRLATACLSEFAASPSLTVLRRIAQWAVA